MGDVKICKRILQLARERWTSDGRESKGEDRQLKIVYIGTASYDDTAAKDAQTSTLCRLASAEVQELSLVRATCDGAKVESLFKEVDIIVVSGGNTLYAVDRWKLFGIDERLREAARQGVVLAGGSAGAICWFDAGHSDSGDPASFLPSAITELTEEEKTSWDYVRVPCLGIVPGLCCPHYDKVQSNGVLRATDFDAMVLRHRGERGIGIDHWAALVINGEHFEVCAADGREGSLLDDGTFSEQRKGRPGVWVIDVQDDGKVCKRSVTPSSGRLDSILEVATATVEDDRIGKIRSRNPCTADIAEH